ncbi:MAG: hypothetical protein Q8O89_06850 [Nanoarchaeota archaeon]|nr:hypothetical protein [Nanoarchaeota archaeon]
MKFKLKKLGKKGFVDDWLYWIPKLIYFNIVVLLVMIMLLMFIRTKIDMGSAETQIYVNRIFYSPTGISYYDEELQRGYPGIIDLQRFNEEILNHSLFFTNPEEQYDTYIAINLSLKYADKKGKDVEAVTYYNKEWYERFVPRIGKKGRGGTKEWTRERDVVVKDDNLLLPGTLTLHIVMPNG